VITQQRVKQLATYDEVTGLFTSRKNGLVLGTNHASGYVQLCLDGKFYRAHRVAWLYMFGVLPSNYIDHINGVRNDNRKENLREATPAQSRWNSTRMGHNKLGIKGVERRGRKYYARITVNRNRISLGIFTEVRAAHRAYMLAAEKYFGSYACEGERVAG
jgi:hypothetical protein